MDETDFDFCSNTYHKAHSCCLQHQPITKVWLTKVVFNGKLGVIKPIEGDGTRNIMLCNICVEKFCKKCTNCERLTVGEHFLPGFSEYCAICISCVVLKRAVFKHKEAVMNLLPKRGRSQELMQNFFDTDVNDDKAKYSCFVEVMMDEMYLTHFTESQFNSFSQKISNLIREEVLSDMQNPKE